MKIIVLFMAAFLCLASCTSQTKKAPLSSDTGSSSHLNLLKKTFTDSLPAPTGWVSDFENLFSQIQKEQLGSVINTFEKETTAQIAVVTIDTNSIEKDKFDELILRIAKKWEVGQKKKDNGVVIGVSKGYRLIRICNGYGIEKVLSNEETKQIIEKYFTPKYRQSAYFDGTYEGLTALIKTLQKRLK